MSSIFSSRSVSVTEPVFGVCLETVRPGMSAMSGGVLVTAVTSTWPVVFDSVEDVIRWVWGVATVVAVAAAAGVHGTGIT